MSKQVLVKIDTHSMVRAVLVIAAFTLAFIFVHRMMHALIIIGFSLFLAIALNPSVSWLARHLPHKSRAFATSVSYIVVVLILGLLIGTTVPTVVKQTASFVETVPGYIDNLQNDNSSISKLIKKYNLQGEIDHNVQEIRSNTGNLAGKALGKVGQVTSSIATILAVLVITFLMLVEAPYWQKWLWGMYGDKRQRKRHQQLAGRMYRVVTGYVNGQVIIAAIGSISALIGLIVLSAIFHTSSTIALPLAGIIFVAELIPMVGVTIGAALVAIFLALSSIPMALIFIGYFTLYQHFENYVIQPVVQSKALDLSPLIIFSSALMGFYLLGPIGAFVSIPLAGCLKVLLLDYLAHRRDGQAFEAEKKEAVKELEEIEA